MTENPEAMLKPCARVNWNVVINFIYVYINIYIYIHIHTSWYRCEYVRYRWCISYRRKCLGKWIIWNWRIYCNTSHPPINIICLKHDCNNALPVYIVAKGYWRCTIILVEFHTSPELNAIMSTTWTLIPIQNEK